MRRIKYNVLADLISFVLSFTSDMWILEEFSKLKLATESFVLKI